MRRFAWLWPLIFLAAACGKDADHMAYPPGIPRQTQSIAMSADGRLLAVVNPDSDTLSLIDPNGRFLIGEIALGPIPEPGPDGRYEPKLGPRGVDLSPDGQLAYVACQWSGQLMVVDTHSGQVLQQVVLGAEPVAVLVHPDGMSVYVSLYQSGEVVRAPLDAHGLLSDNGLGVVRQRTTDRPWGLALDGSAQTLVVTRFLTSPGLDLLDAATLSVRATAGFDDMPYRGNRLLAHGVPRGLYGATLRPVANATADAAPAAEQQIWVPHMLLSTDVAQPDLDFESTVFPAVSVRGLDGSAKDLLTVDSRLPGIDGQIADVVSGPRALAFTPDGSLALLVNMSSEDVLVIDADRRVQVGLVRPLPGDLPQGIVISPDGTHAYIDERASGDVAVLAIVRDAQGKTHVQLDGTPIGRFKSNDPMPPELRLGQRLFHSANSAEFPLTKNFWVACASCHLEGRSDAVIWRFTQGPRDTPSNAGGTVGTGFLMRNATRNAVTQYDETIRVEQGGDIDASRTADMPLLTALSHYVDRAIPFARSPEVDVQSGKMSAAAQHGQQIFMTMRCPMCHSGTRYTDSGAGNVNLDLGGTVLLHDIGTCATTPYADQPVVARDGSPRPTCQFDTPSLNGLFDTPPYFHDGSAATLDAVIAHKVQFLGLSPLSAGDQADLVAFLRSL